MNYALNNENDKELTVQGRSRRDKTIRAIVVAGLCTGCGTCAGICPRSAIRLMVDNRTGNYSPKINYSECINCGYCAQSCPGQAVDFKKLNINIFGKEPSDNLVGNYFNFYVSNSTDYDIRYNSTSGGLVTQLLIYALENGIIDGALVTKMRDDDPLSPQPFIARTREEIISASKSKYCPVPVNSGIKELLKSKGRFAIVGLPCHIQGFRKASMVNYKLNEKIVLTFGLLCSNNRNFFAIDYLLSILHIKRNQVAKLDFRGEGYLGNLSIILKDRRKISVPYLWYNRWLRSFFYLQRCTLCTDHTSELSDISFGDNCMPDYHKESIGSSIVICRTKTGEKFLESAYKTNCIELTKADPVEVIRSKMTVLKQKKRYLKARLTIVTLLGKKVPFYPQLPSTRDPFAYKNAHIVLIPHVISSLDWNYDDRWANEQLYKLLKNREHVALIKGDYTPSELKGLIGQCDIFIGSRMHANIASLSQGIPTLAIGWSDKYSGIMRRLGMLEYVCHYKTLTFEEVQSKVDCILAKKEIVRNQLLSKVEFEKNTALEAIALLCSLLKK
jgi:coenzyme F420 hydrogenase subunit beta